MSPEAPETSPYLEVLCGPQRGLRAPLDRPSLRVGRGRESELRLEDATRSLSGTHLEVRREGDDCTLLDRSRNGTWWCATPGALALPVPERGHRLRHGEVLRLAGGVELRFCDPQQVHAERRSRAVRRATYLALALLVVAAALALVFLTDPLGGPRPAAVPAR